MKRLFPLMALAGIAASGMADISAQNLILDDGRTIPAPKIRRTGDTLMVPTQIGNSIGDIGYPVKNVVRAEFPAPTQLAAAQSALAEGRAAEALALVTPPTEFFQPIAGVPGSWWGALALVRADALRASSREKEADALLRQIIQTEGPFPSAALAKLRLARSQIARGKFGEIEAACTVSLKDHPTDESVAAEAWLLRGDAFTAQKLFEPALMAYLRIPALYFKQSACLPPALLGSARSYLSLKETKHASDAFREIVKNHPATTQAREATLELQHLPQTETHP